MLLDSIGRHAAGNNKTSDRQPVSRHLHRPMATVRSEQFQAVFSLADFILALAFMRYQRHSWTIYYAVSA